MTCLPWGALGRACAGALLAVSAAVQAQAPSPMPPFQPIRPMSPEAPAVTAFFYKNPVVLDRTQHQGLRLRLADARFAAKAQAVPLLATEFPEACLEYPIAFAKGADGKWVALALTGLQADANAFIDAQGKWAARYVPASVRRYPFILAEGGQDQLSLAIDMAAAHQGGEGQALFDDKGEPTEFLSRLMPLLADFQVQAARTDALARQLEEARLLSQQNLQVRLGDGRSAVVEGVWIVDEAKLRDLPDDKVLAWFKGGEMAAIHAHMLSLRNLVPLLERSQPPAGAGAPAPATTPAPSGKKPAGRKDKSAS